MPASDEDPSSVGVKEQNIGEDQVRMASILDRASRRIFAQELCWYCSKTKVRALFALSLSL
jgi:hypothetical protein